jgi:retron-type reverse transcriptase
MDIRGTEVPLGRCGSRSCPYYRLHLKDSTTLGEGRGNAFITFLKERRKGDCVMLETPEKIRELQRKLYRKAKQEKEYRFYLLYDKVYRVDILSHAYNLVKSNKGAPGVDGETFECIEEREGGIEGYLEAIAGELKRKEYKPQPVRRVYIPKSGGGKRPLGIPTVFSQCTSHRFI